MKTLIIGLGNPILTDDGIGVKVAYAIEQVLSDTPAMNGIEVTEASVGGLRLMEMMVGYDRVIIIDALTHGEDPPGTVHRMTLEDLRTISPTQHSASAHDTSLVTAMKAGEQMGLYLPEEIIIYGVSVENVSDFGDMATPAVEQSIPQVMSAIFAELESQT